MSTKRGFTLIEILVVAGVLIVSLGAWIYVFRNTSGVNEEQTIDQDYYYHYSLLLSRIKTDLRSAKDWKKVNDETYSMTILAASKGGFPAERNVVYKVTENGKRIERNDGIKTTVFDFPSLKGGGKFVFRISQ